MLGADLCGCRVFGVAAWDVQHDGNVDLQRDLVVTPSGRAEVRTDNIDVAQFMYLLLDNPRISHFLDAVCRKGVLLLGRFTEERKEILDALRCELRNRGYLAMVFDFERAKERDFTETVMLLAGMSRFIIADITKPKSSPLELQAVVPNYMVPLVPIIADGESPFAMFSDLRGKYPWVLDPLCYSSAADLVKVLERAVIQPALAKHNELLALKAKPIKMRRTADYDQE